MNSIIPLVSIGLPVFNGEKIIEKTIINILSQTYKNIEVIISDNGSFDNTIKIIEKYNKRFLNLKVVKSKINRGSIWNFNKVFLESNGKYFCWFAADDFRSATFIEECVKVLEKNHNTVLCQSLTKIFVDSNHNLLSINSLTSFININDKFRRYKETLNNFPATAIYGLIRVSAMKNTKLFQKVIAADLVFIQELSLYGDFQQLDKNLFYYLIRPKWNTINQDYFTFTGKKNKPFWYIPFFYVFFFNLKNIINTNFELNEKIILIFILLEYNLFLLIKKIKMKLIKSIYKITNNSKIIESFYFNNLHNPNVKIVDYKQYYNRIIKPMIGSD